MKTIPDPFNPEALDQALGQLIIEAQATRDCFIIGDEEEGREHFTQAVHQVSLAIHQISLLKRK